MIVFRYLIKEIILALVGLTSILLLLFLSNQFVHYLIRAASGKIPAAILTRLILLEIPNLLSLLLPLGLFVAILLAVSRLYADNEMTVLHACGFSLKQLITMVMSIAAVITIIVAVMLVWASPHIAAARDRLLTSHGPAILLQSVAPERLQEINHGKQMLYLQSIDENSGVARNIFLAKRNKTINPYSHDYDWQIITAKQALVRSDKDGNKQIVLLNGNSYSGRPGSGEFRVTKFANSSLRLPQSQGHIRASKKERSMPTAELLPIWNRNPKRAAEIQWRISVPLMVLVLALLAIPYAQVKPRQGKFANMLPAIFIYVLYANLMFIGRDWIAHGRIPTWLGLWWIHILIAAWAAYLLYRNNRLSVAA